VRRNAPDQFESCARWDRRPHDHSKPYKKSMPQCKESHPERLKGPHPRPYEGHAETRKGELRVRQRGWALGGRCGAENKKGLRRQEGGESKKIGRKAPRKAWDRGWATLRWNRQIPPSLFDKVRQPGGAAVGRKKTEAACRRDQNLRKAVHVEPKPC